jgi:CCR4-NOT transcription complex subunit 6
LGFRIMNSKDYQYSWHLSLRVDRPVEGCTMRPHSYMYGKKLDDRDKDKPLQPHSKKMRVPPPEHEFSYRWFRGPTTEPCAFEGCPRRTSFSPHDWSMHALGGSGCSLQCVSTQSSLYKCTFCNSSCFVNAWKTQYTIPKEMRQHGSRSNTPMRQRSNSTDSSVDDDGRSIGSSGSMGRMNGSKSPANCSESGSNLSAASNPGTPRGFLGSYINKNNPYNGVDQPQGDEWVEISREALYMPGPEDIGKKVKLEAAAYSSETGELLMHRVVKTDLVLARAPDPVKRPVVTAKSSPAGGGARFRIVSYNLLAEIYATQQQYPYCDLWALSWEFRCVPHESFFVLCVCVCVSRISVLIFMYFNSSDAAFKIL